VAHIEGPPLEHNTALNTKAMSCVILQTLLSDSNCLPPESILFHHTTSHIDELPVPLSLCKHVFLCDSKRTRR